MTLFANLFSSSEASFKQGHYQKALSELEQALSLEPDNLAAHVNYGMVLSFCGQYSKAVTTLQAVLQHAPNNAEAWIYLGAALRALQHYSAAIEALKKGISLQPHSAIAHTNLGLIYTALARNYEAELCYRSALGIDKQQVEAWTNLGIALLNQCHYSESIDAHKQALAIKHDFFTAFSNLQMALQYHPDASAATLKQEVCYWKRQQTTTNHHVSTSVHRRLRIGYVSADFLAHPVGFFLRGIFAAHDRNTIATYCYANQSDMDEISTEFKTRSDGWRNIHGMDDEQVIDLIRNDEIDILVDLSGHTAGGRLPVFEARCAAVQLSWLGYFGSTGMAQIDAIISSALLTERGGELFFTEKLIKTKGCHFCYTPPSYAERIRPIRNNKRQSITFGSFNNTAKLNNGVIRLWSRLLSAIPDSRLVLKWKTFGDPNFCQHTRNRFSQYGTDLERLELRPSSEHRDMLKQYSDIDIALDPFPFSGALTSCEALYMGIPVITMPLNRPVSRQTAAILKDIGFTEYIANTADEYIDIARGLASSPETLNELRTGLRQRLQESDLFKPKKFATNLEAHFFRLIENQRSLSGA